MQEKICETLKGEEQHDPKEAMNYKRDDNGGLKLPGINYWLVLSTSEYEIFISPVWVTPSFT